MIDRNLERLTTEKQQPVVEVCDKVRDDLFDDYPDLVSVGVAVKRTNRQPTGEPCIQLGVRRKLDERSLRHAGGAPLPPEVDGVPCDVVEVGEIVSGPLWLAQVPRDLPAREREQQWAFRLAKRLRERRRKRGPIGQGLIDDLLDLLGELCGDRPPPRTGKHRPAMPGISIGHVDVTAGTLGIYVQDRDTGETFVLSNNHVIADTDRGDVGDPIVQPGVHDGGREPDDVLCQLARAVPLDPSGSNRVDGAVGGDLDPANIDRAILEIGEPAGWLPRADVAVGMEVQKSGRTTGHTRGSINAVGQSVRVNYGNGRTIRFDDQIQITPGSFSDGGDSGSAILDMERRVVGLLFAGSDFATIGNPIEHVFDELNVEV